MPKIHLTLLISVGLVAGAPLSRVASVAIGLDPLVGQMLLSLLVPAIVILAQHCLRFDAAAVLPPAFPPDSALRRYVPRGLAAQLDSGHSLQCGEREVSVLFVDIRGFTSFAEGRRAVEIFTVVNRYVEEVSAIVCQHGGCVVEFSGDGIMALFGAPHPLPGKERAAVEAGLAIIAAMDGRRPIAGVTAGPGLLVGVGVATGTDYVGDFTAADHTIWSAVGNATNLAARLQSLSRDFNAAMVIDAPTRAVCGAVAAGFEVRRNVAIRGRRHTQDLYVLPLIDRQSAPRVRTRSTARPREAHEFRLFGRSEAPTEDGA